jgi:phenylacetate-CoA ligase
MEIINKLKDCFGHDGIIEIEYVNEIPLLASGKRKRVINKYISYS